MTVIDTRNRTSSIVTCNIDRLISNDFFANHLLFIIIGLSLIIILLVIYLVYYCIVRRRCFVDESNDWLKYASNEKMIDELHSNPIYYQSSINTNHAPNPPNSQCPNTVRIRLLILNRYFTHLQRPLFINRSIIVDDIRSPRTAFSGIDASLFGDCKDDYEIVP